MCVCVSLVRGTQSSLAINRASNKSAMATAPAETISGLRTRCYYFPWVFECTSVYTVYTVYLLLCCLWSHGNPPMHNVINVSAMKFLSNWLRIKKFTLRNFTLAERDSSEKKVTIWEGHDVEKSCFFFKNLDFSPKSHVFVWFYYILRDFLENLEIAPSSDQKIIDEKSSDEKYFSFS